MRILTVTLAVLLAGLVGGERWLRETSYRARDLKAVVRSFPEDVPALPGDVTSLEVVVDQSRWRYVRRDSVWFHPALHDVHADGAAIHRVLRSLLTSSATIVSATGLEPHHSTGALRSLAFQTLGLDQAFELGDRLPGATVPERYIRVVSSDTVYQLHGDPWSPIGDALDPAPMLDRKVIPTALSRRSVRRAVIARDDLVVELTREEIESERPSSLGTEFVWYRSEGGGRDSLNSSAAFSYVGFLQRLTWSEVEAASKGEEDVGLVVLIDDLDQTDSLIVRRTGDRAYVMHRPSGRAYRIEDVKVEKLFTKLDLHASLPDPNPFRRP
ncbi:MAG: hypothetical protein CME26_00210 [Gemmatimonadetes bacterium]|nr:hypothetical protein [Gemmatimonadota bacterium]